MESALKISLFIPCYVDQMSPQTAGVLGNQMVTTMADEYAILREKTPNSGQVLSLSLPVC